MSNNSEKKVNSSPKRHTFGFEKYMAAHDDPDSKETEAAVKMLQILKQLKEQREQNIVDPEWQKDNLEYDLRSTQWICDKVKTSDIYAQNLYAAMCNRDFQKLDVMPILTDKKWSCSWRYAGGIIADMREDGDYIDWYCSGMHDRDDFVRESIVTDEVRSDLQKLGWIVLDEDES